MRKKIVSLLLLIMICIGLIPNYSYAANETGKVIYISMNRTNLDSMDNIPILGELISQRGYVGLMNVRGDGGISDERSYATIGAGTRAALGNVTDSGYISFENKTDANSKVYEASTGEKPKEINNLLINKAINNNVDKGTFGATLGVLGQTLADNNKSVALLGNSDIVSNGELVKIRNAGLICMDNIGRIPAGNVDDINIDDYEMPYGIRTDYEKLAQETKSYYESSDALFIELGDTYRLDKYKANLNEETLTNMRDKIYENINTYLTEVFNMVDENDVVYIVSEFPSTIDYNNRRRLSPVIKFKGEGKGLLRSTTTRRDGVVANLDVAVDILNEFGLSSENTLGRYFTTVDKDENVEYLDSQYRRIVSVNNIRSTVVNTFVGIVSASWVIAMLALLVKDRLPHKDTVFIVLKELIKLGLIMPFALLLEPIFGAETQLGILLGVIATTSITYLSGWFFFKKNDLKQMAYYAMLTIALIVVDALIGTFFMKYCVMSYDSIIGARYYGVGNEYQGVTIASAIFGFSVLLHYNKIPKWLVGVFSVIILITSASQSMGANVGAAISECVAYLLFMMLI